MIPAGMLPFALALGRVAQARCAAAWEGAKPGERAFLVEGAPAERLKITLWTTDGSLASRAYGELRPLLADGTVPTLLRGVEGAPTNIDPAAWHASGADRVADLLRGTVSFGAIGRGEVLIRSGDLDAALKGEAVPMRVPRVAPVSAAEPARGKGGNRSNPETDRFWIEVCRLVSEGEITCGRAGLAELMAQWSIDHMERPWDAETVRKKVGHLFKALRWT